jgi:hypothetical protein
MLHVSVVSQIMVTYVNIDVAVFRIAGAWLCAAVLEPADNSTEPQT